VGHTPGSRYCLLHTDGKKKQKDDLQLIIISKGSWITRSRNVWTDNTEQNMVAELFSGVCDFCNIQLAEL
jgi:hypothetical protein